MKQIRNRYEIEMKQIQNMYIHSRNEIVMKYIYEIKRNRYKIETKLI